MMTATVHPNSVVNKHLQNMCIYKNSLAGRY